MHYLSSSSTNYLEEPFYLVLLFLFQEGFVMGHFILLTRITEPCLALPGLQFLDWIFNIVYCYLKSWSAAFSISDLASYQSTFCQIPLKKLKDLEVFCISLSLMLSTRKFYFVWNWMSLYSATLSLQLSLLLTYAVYITICALLMFWPLGLCLP